MANIDKKKSPKPIDKLFLNDVIQGLSDNPKHLSSKYFYDKMGDQLFQKIMHTQEYYLFRSEKDILSEQSAAITDTLKVYSDNYDLVELGAGDASKSIFLIKELVSQGILNTYYPVDISGHVIQDLEETLPVKIPDLKLKGFNGEYINMLKEINKESDKPKLVLFLGSNIGNYFPDEAIEFCRALYDNLNPGDLVFMGFDLQKHPLMILNAYNDSLGYTRFFNLNLLKRINHELGGDFEPFLFDHYPTYDPVTGTCKSYLISLKDQEVHIGNEFTVTLQENEPIRMEVSQKYKLEETDKMAENCSFKVIEKFQDNRKWFVDCLWQR